MGDGRLELREEHEEEDIISLSRPGIGSISSGDRITPLLRDIDGFERLKGRG
jgi:hypothetical protein